MNGHGKMANGGGLPADISKELEKRNIGQRYHSFSISTYLFRHFSLAIYSEKNMPSLLFSIFSSVSNILGKNRNKGNSSSSNNASSNNQWNFSPSSIPRRRSGPTNIQNGTDGDYREGFPSTNRRSPGKALILFKLHKLNVVMVFWL